MPNRDETGPPGKGKGMVGQGMGVLEDQCPECGEERLHNLDSGRRAKEVGWGVGAGPGGFCVCLKCNKEVKHITGTPCSEMKCPDCGAPMARKL